MALEAVKSWMKFFGWTNDGAPGAVKTVYGGTVVAHYGDETWIKDVQEAIDKAERQRLISEIEHRERIKGFGGGDSM